MVKVLTDLRISMMPCSHGFGGGVIRAAGSIDDEAALAAAESSDRSPSSYYEEAAPAATSVDAGEGASRAGWRFGNFAALPMVVGFDRLMNLSDGLGPDPLFKGIQGLDTITAAMGNGAFFGSAMLMVMIGGIFAARLGWLRGMWNSSPEGVASTSTTPEDPASSEVSFRIGRITRDIYASIPPPKGKETLAASTGDGDKGQGIKSGVRF